jgi:hypothetical protein
MLLLELMIKRVPAESRYNVKFDGVIGVFDSVIGIFGAFERFKFGALHLVVSSKYLIF